MPYRQKRAKLAIACIDWLQFCWQYFLKGMGFGIFYCLLGSLPAFFLTRYCSCWQSKVQYALLESLSYAL